MTIVQRRRCDEYRGEIAWVEEVVTRDSAIFGETNWFSRRTCQQNQRDKCTYTRVTMILSTKRASQHKWLRSCKRCQNIYPTFDCTVHPCSRIGRDICIRLQLHPWVRRFLRYGSRRDGMVGGVLMGLMEGVMGGIDGGADGGS